MMTVKKFWVILSFHFLFITPAFAQSDLSQLIKPNLEKTTPLTDQELLDSTQKKLNELIKQINSLEKPSEDFTLEAEPDFRTKLLKELQLFYEQILEALQSKKQLAEEKNKAEETSKTWSKDQMAKQASFQLMDQLIGQTILLGEKKQSIKEALKTLKITIELDEKNFSETEKERRALQEKIETKPEDPSVKKWQLELAKAKIESQIAQAKITLGKIQAQNSQLTLEITQIRKKLNEEKIQWLRQNIQISEQDLQTKLKEMQRERTKLGNTINSLRQELKKLERTPLQNKSTQSKTLRDLNIQRFQNLIKNLSSRYQRIDEEEQVWQWIYLLFIGEAKTKDLQTWKQQAKNQIQELSYNETLLNTNLAEYRKLLKENKDRQEETSAMDLAELNFLKEEQKLYETMMQDTQDHLAKIFQEKQLQQKFIAEIEARRSETSWTDEIALVWDYFLKAWNYELTSVDDRPITVKKVLFALLLLLLGVRISRWLAFKLENRLLSKLRLDAGAISAIQTISFYLLIALNFILILYIVNVPLTLFTVLGGALIIGIGFGSQNIMNNFISGLILLIERPIKIGDMIEVDENYGIVERVGARSTRVRSFNNIHMILPNSDFLQKKVVNWTLSDDLIRTQITVGIAYGSPTRDAAKLIRKAVDEHGKILKKPEPIVLFTEFGDNSLNFEVHFWIRMKKIMDRKMIESDLRFRIDSLFREANITIAFPQRDVHLDSVKPLEVKLVESSTLTEE